MGKAEACEAAPTATGLLALPRQSLDSIITLSGYHGAVAACCCRELRDVWLGVSGRDMGIVASAMLERYGSANEAIANLYGAMQDSVVALVGDGLPPVQGLLDCLPGASRWLTKLEQPLAATPRRAPEQPAAVPLGYFAANTASDAQALALVRHLLAQRKHASRHAADDTGANDEVGSEGGGDGEDSASEASENLLSEASENLLSEASEDLLSEASEDLLSETPDEDPLPAAVVMGAAFAGHEATVVELLRHGADPLRDALPGAVRAGNARLCAALLERARLRQLTYDWFWIEGAPKGSGGPSRMGVSVSRPWIEVNDSLIALACASARLPQLCAAGGSARVGHSGRPGLAIPEAAVAAAEAAADAAVASMRSTPGLGAFGAELDAAAAAATAAALAALRPGKLDHGASSSNAGSSGGSGDPGGLAHVETPLPTSNHRAVLLLLLHATSYRLRIAPRWGSRWGHGLRAAAVAGNWQVVSELLLAGADLWDPADPFHHEGTGATLMYLALVYGQWHVAGRLLRWHWDAPGVCTTSGCVGAGVCALVTRVFGRACPMMRRLRREPTQCWDRELGELVMVLLVFVVLAVAVFVLVMLLG